MGNIAIAYAERCAAHGDYEYMVLVWSWSESSINIDIDSADIDTTASRNKEHRFPGIAHHRFVLLCWQFHMNT